mgnify:CR=1 FL=1
MILGSQGLIVIGRDRDDFPVVQMTVRLYRIFDRIVKSLDPLIDILHRIDSFDTGCIVFSCINELHAAHDIHLDRAQKEKVGDRDQRSAHASQRSEINDLVFL